MARSIVNLDKLAEARDAADAAQEAATLAAEKVAEALAIAMEPSEARLASADRSQPFNTRLRSSTLAAIEARARAEGATLKQVICRALADAGIAVAPADLEDGTPRRRAA